MPKAFGRVLWLGLIVALAAAAGPGVELDAAAPALELGAAGDVAVTVTYKGKGTVDETHEIWVFLFPSAEIAGARPLATEVVKKNGGTATFANVTQSPVYIRTVYDEKGDYDGFSGPPPPGTPIGQYSKDAKTIAPVTPGPGAKVKVTFTDAVRMQ